MSARGGRSRRVETGLAAARAAAAPVAAAPLAAGMLAAGLLTSGLLAAGLLTSGLLAAAPLTAQEKPALVLRGGQIHTLAGPVIENGSVVVVDGLITAVGVDVEVPAGAREIDLRGLRVYPGFFDAMTRLGLTEVGAVDVTNDYAEMGDWNPHLVAASAVNPASEHIPVARTTGVTHAVTAPGGGSGIHGQATLLNLDGWTVEEMQVERSVGMVMQWPGIRTREFDRERFETVERDFGEALEEYEAELRELRDWFQAAKDRLGVMRARPEGAGTDLPLEALARVLEGELPMIIIADEARDIRNAVEFAEAEGLDFILAGGREAYRVAGFLAEHDVRVILGRAQVMPSGPDAPYDEPYRNAAALHEAGVRFAMASFGSSDVRTLPFEIGTAVAFGLPVDAAIRAVTLEPARILAVDDRLGTLEPGKIANIQVVDGNPLEIRTALHHLFIGGVEVDLVDKHRRLYDRYRARPRAGG